MATLTESQWEGLEQLLVETGKGTRHESFDSYRLSEGLHFLALLKNLPKGWSACTWSKGDIKAMLPVLGARWVVETGTAGDFAIVQTEGLVTMPDVAERLRLTTVPDFTLIAVSRLWKISDEFSAEEMLRRLESPMDIKVIEVISKYGAWRRLGDGIRRNEVRISRTLTSLRSWPPSLCIFLCILSSILSGMCLLEFHYSLRIF